MMEKPFSDAVRRFVLTSIPSVPHIETLLMLFREADRDWTTDEVARRLFITPQRAQAVIDDLCRADLLDCETEQRRYRSRRDPPSLASLLSELDAAYTRHLREVTALIHSNVERKAERFAQAFNWERK
jgi:Mn-dependent DtxR family transcriptional regulator